MHQALDGNQKGQLDATKAKANKWAKNIQKGKLDRLTAWHALTTTIRPGLKYTLGACTMTYKDGDKMVSGLYRALLPALGANWNYPKIWRYCPAAFLGLGLPHPHIKQEVEHLKNILTLDQHSSATGRLL